MHGKPFVSADFNFECSGYNWLSHLIVADIVFYECLCKPLPEFDKQELSQQIGMLEEIFEWPAPKIG